LEVLHWTSLFTFAIRYSLPKVSSSSLDRMWVLVYSLLLVCHCSQPTHTYLEILLQFCEDTHDSTVMSLPLTYYPMYNSRLKILTSQ
jgi:hypothetical protein